jgi:glycosyltransferase involved in cell wall biosynthesis
MRVWFLARRHMPFSPASVARRPLGGGESALHYVARGLAGLGHEVAVINRCAAEAGVYDGVRYYDAAGGAQWRSAANNTPPDVLVICRAMEDVRIGIRARARVFWSHDYQGVPKAPLSSGLGRQLGIVWRQATGPLFHARVDRIVVISAFLAEVFQWLFRVPADKLAVVPVGVDADAFAGSAPPHSPLRFIHSSVPDRGLAPLLQDIFPAIRARYPQAELHVYSYQSLDSFRHHATSGVHLHGWAPKPELVRSLRQSTLMLYPATAEETGCIAVLESMAAGTPAVTSSLGVLAELAADGRRGIAVDGWPGRGDFSLRFVDATVRLLADPERLAQMRTTAHDYAITHHDWDAIALRWHQVLEATLDGVSRREPTE